MSEQPLLEVYALFAQWYNQNAERLTGGKNLRELGTVFTHTFPIKYHKRFGRHQWQIAINGTDEDLHDPIGECSIKPVHMHIYRDGWLIGITTPLGGETIVQSELLHGLDKEFSWLLKRLLRIQKDRVTESVSPN